VGAVRSAFALRYEGRRLALATLFCARLAGMGTASRRTLGRVGRKDFFQTSKTA
jgi:hypothetical protein